MDGQRIADQVRTGPVRPPRPSRSFDYIDPTPIMSPQAPAGFASTLKNRKSSSYARGPSQLQNQLSPGFSPSFRYSGATSATGETGTTGGSMRKKSFKKAVRRLFGRKPKDGSPPASMPRSSFNGYGPGYGSGHGHGYHQSVSEHDRVHVCIRADKTEGSWSNRACDRGSTTATATKPTVTSFSANILRASSNPGIAFFGHAVAFIGYAVTKRHDFPQKCTAQAT